jgi:hypothetical protein
MSDNPNYDQQKDEIDLLQNILFDKMNIENEDPFEITANITANIENPKMEFLLKIKLNNEYPDKSPEFTLIEENNFLSSSKLNDLIEKLKQICNEYIGMPVMYQLYETILSFADDEEQLLINEKLNVIKLEEEQKLLEMKKKEEEEKLIEQRTYTPVTKKLFEEWEKKFIEKKRKENIENTKFSDRLTGRQFFMNKNLKVEVNEDEIESEENVISTSKNKNEEENLEYNPDLYDEDIGNIDFDKEDEDL